MLANHLYALALCLISLPCLQWLQSANYRPFCGYFAVYVSRYGLALVFLQALCVLCWLFCPFRYSLTLTLLFACFFTFFTVKKGRRTLVFTKRIARIFVVQLVVLVLLCAYANAYFLPIFLPVTTLVAFALCLPVDNLIARQYVTLAQAKLTSSGAKVIAITGSFGKTSTKNMLCALLADSVCSPESYNTPLGIAKFINNANLAGCKYVILEFGARKKGDISYLCKTFSPSFGIVTGICEQHLSTFGNVANVAKEKFQLVGYLPKNGVCVLNAFNAYTARFASMPTNCKTVLSSQDVALSVKQVCFDGTTLQLRFKEQSYAVRLPQIASHVTQTFAMCLQTCLQLGQDVKTTIDACKNVGVTPHRLQLIKTDDFYILDDSYNASIVGVQSCCQTLNCFDCVKVAITQGVVECGKQAKQLNAQCGKMLGEACNAVVVLGKNSKYLTLGAMQTTCKILHADSLLQAVNLAQQFVKGGILLFQNDVADVSI